MNNSLETKTWVKVMPNHEVCFLKLIPSIEKPVKRVQPTKN
jgi:hypothetical protein